MRPHPAFFILTLGLATPALSADLPGAPAANADNVCGQALAANKADIEKALISGEAWSTPLGTSGQPTIVWTTRSDDGFYTALATRRPGNVWQAWKIAVQSGVVGAKSAPNGAFAIFTMWSSGDPGQSYTVLSRRDGTSEPGCAEIAFPSDLNNPGWMGEFLAFSAFNGEAGGTGTVVGAFAANRGKPPPFTHYTYDTNDGGRTWSQPTGHVTEPKPPGVYVDLVKGVPSSLLATLPANIN